MLYPRRKREKRPNLVLKKDCVIKADAIIVKPTEGNSYADILHQIKQFGHNLKLRSAPRKTQNGGILLVLENVQYSQELRQNIQGALGNKGQVWDKTLKVTIEVIISEELNDALKKET